jgi:structural maintenance of chromosome 1
LSNQIKSEKKNVKDRQAAKAELQDELRGLEGQLDKLKEKLNDAKNKLEEVSSKLDDVRDAARKTQKDLDRALKEIAGWNDEIEKSASDRHAIYRRCRMEEIDLPLVRGSLDKVPLVEVCLAQYRRCFGV